MITLRAVSKTYGDGPNRVDALKNIDLTVRDGEFVSIMGPSGSGKSTLLNIVSALDAPSSGQVTIDGRDISQLDDDALTLFRRRKIGLIFQFFNLLPTLDALENTLLPLTLERKITAADEARASELLAKVGLGERIRHRTYQLSGGEMQRVAIARALIAGPALILADEPTGNLDSTTGAAILSLLKQASLDTGTTVIMVTHDRSAAQVGDRILWLKDGQVRRDERTPASSLQVRKAAE